MTTLKGRDAKPLSRVERRYEALASRGRDQSGTPEGELCSKMAAALLKRYPGLDAPARALEKRWWEERFREEWERNLIVAAIQYHECAAYSVRGSRKKIVTYETDEPTQVLIVHTIAVLRPKLSAVLTGTLIGFLSGALPLPTEDTDADGETGMTPEEMEMAVAAYGVGRSHGVRTALREGDAE